MLCDDCSERPAAIHLTRISDDECSQVHLCESCAEARGLERSIYAPTNEEHLDHIVSVIPMLEAEPNEDVRQHYARALQRAIDKAPNHPVPDSVRRFLLAHSPS
jgi:protein-arginine kinase activator protein McsA